MQKKITLLLTLLLCLNLTTTEILAQTNNKVKVYVHEPVELLLTIYNLTPPVKKSIKQTKKDRDWVDEMIQPLIAPFEPYKKHTVVLASVELYKKYQIWAPTLVGEIGVQATQMPLDAQKIYPNVQSVYAQDMRAFIELANQFYKDTNFKAIFEKNGPFYAAIEKEVRDNMPNEALFPMIEQYYQKQFLSFNICPSPLLPAGNGMGFGPRRTTEAGIEVFNVFSGIDAPKIDKQNLLKENGTYGFNNPKWIREISTHEFGHSFVNEPLFAHKQEFNRYKQLLKPIKKKMKTQGYWYWGTVLAEHLVRMGEIRIAEKMGLQAESQKLYDDYYLNRQFIYLPHFLEVIKQYEDNPKYTTFADFIPEIINSLAHVDAKKAKRDWRKKKSRIN
ncbi:MAG: DUF4932 domain-containing protein [Bacteroidota bacterium]